MSEAIRPAHNPNGDIVVTVLAVVENDADIIDGFLTDLDAVLSPNYRHYEILIVDNGSVDELAEKVRALQKRFKNIRYVRLSRTYDRETAIVAGMDNSIGDYVVIMEIEHDPPELIPTLVAEAVSGANVVIADRSDRRDDRPLVRALAKPGFKLASRILGVEIEPNASYFRVMSRQVVNSITRIRNKSRYLKYLNSVVGFRQTHIPYERKFRRPVSKHRVGAWSAIRKGADLIFSNSAAPLRMVTFLGLIASFLSLGYIVYIVVVRLVNQRLAEGWLTTNLVSTTMFFFLFIILTVLSEYMARILEEVKEMPLYFTEYETNSSVSGQSTEENNRVNVV